MRFVVKEVLKRERLILSLKVIPIMVILVVFLFGVALSPGHAQDRQRHGTAVSCPPPEVGGQWIARGLEFPRDSVVHAGGGRAIPFLINVNNGGTYIFYINRSTAGAGFQVGMFDDVITDFIQTTGRPPNWNTVMPYTHSVIAYGGKIELKLPPYFAKASQAGVAQVWVLLMIHPDDQTSSSMYSVYYTADQCLPASTTTPSAPGGCYWNEVTLLGQPTGSFECLCNGKPADPKRCGPKP